MKKKPLLVYALALMSALPVFADGTYTIYPVPQEQVAVQGTVRLSADKIQVICGSSIDEYTKNRIKTILEEHGLIVNSVDALFADAPTAGYTHIYVGVNDSKDAADNLATTLGLKRDVFSLTKKYDRHIVSITGATDGEGADILILGENTDAAFIGMASIEQILDAYALQNYTIPCGTIYDYADQKNRGIVEGYYGVPYSLEVKKDLMRFMMRHKMNTYLYGAKSDYYHSTYWQQAYPTTISEDDKKIGRMSQSMIKELTEVAHDTKVNFVWAIHPGNSFLGSTTVVSDIMNKFKLMYNLGVRQFGVFVDDVSIPTTESDFALNAERVTQIQQAIEAEWNKDGALPADTVKPLQFVPQIYCSSFAGGGEEQRKGFFTALKATPANVDIYTTGWGVWSVPNSGDVEQVRQYLERDVAWWWNYPCNDNDNDKIFPMDMYSNFSDESHISSTATVDRSLQNCIGVLSNPMQQGEVSKTALFGVADYAWNNDAFDNAANWEASFAAILKNDEAAKAYRLLSPYLRYYDSGNLDQLITNYKYSLSQGTPNGAPLTARMQEVIDAAAAIQNLGSSDNESDRLFYEDIAPWLNKVKSMAEQVIALLASAEGDDEKTQWETYAPTLKRTAALDTDDNFKAPQLSGSVGSTLSLTSTLTHPSNQVLLPFIDYMQQNALGDLLDTDGATTDRATIFSNLESPKGTITSSSIYAFTSGLNTLSKGNYIGLELPQPIIPSDVTLADTLLDHFTALYSANGKDWNVYNGSLPATDYVKYFCFVNETDTPRALRLTRRVFSIGKPVESPAITSTTIPSGDIYDNHTANYMADGDYTTYTCIYRNQADGDAYVVKLREMTTIGDVRICMGTVNGDYMTVGRVQVSADGENWTTLTVKGSTTTNFTMSLRQVVKYSDEMSYCDFDGGNREAQYVRLYLSTPNKSKWLRLYEIEVNKQTDAAKYKAKAYDAGGTALTALTDAKGYTGIERASNSLTYSLLNAQNVTALKLYEAVAGDDFVPATIRVQDAAGLWVDFGQLEGGLQTLDLSEFPSAKAVEIAWKGATPPAIYEITETLDSSSKPVVSGISPLNHDNTDVTLTQEGGRLHLTSAKGIKRIDVITADGRQILTQTFGGQSDISLPSISAVAGAYVVKAVMADGSTATFKVFLK